MSDIEGKATRLGASEGGKQTSFKAVQGYHVIKPEDLQWRPSNLMKIPNADYLERTGSENIGARLWRLPPKSANTLHKHIRSEEFYFVLEGTGRIRVGDETLTVPKYGGVLVGPDQLRQVFNDTDDKVLWLIVGAPEELEFLQGSKSKIDLAMIYPEDPKQLPKELAGEEWPPKGSEEWRRDQQIEIKQSVLRINEKHWYGATPTAAMTHIAIQEALDGKVVDRMEHVTDK